MERIEILLVAIIPTTTMKQQSYESTVLLQQWVILQPTEYDGGWHKMDSFVLKQRNKRDINQQLRIWDKGALEWIIAAHNVCRRCLNEDINTGGWISGWKEFARF